MKDYHLVDERIEEFAERVKYIHDFLCHFNLGDKIDQASFERHLGTKEMIKIDRRWGRWKGLTVIDHLLKRAQLTMYVSSGKLYLMKPGEGAPEAIKK